MSRKKVTLTEADWEKVFKLRCRTKQGQYLSPEDLKLIHAAFTSDPTRYSLLDNRVFEATKPFGAR